MKKLIAILSSFVAIAFFAIPVFAAGVVEVTPSNPEGWSSADTRPGGTIEYVEDMTSPYPDGALRLTTDNTNAAKAQYIRAESLPVADVTEMSYWNKTNAGPVHAAASFQFLVDLNGDTVGGFTTFVYEPYWNGTVTQGVWEQWDVDAGEMWSSRTFNEGTCMITAGAGGPPLYSLSDIQTMCPDATVLGYGVNVGTYNPGYDVYVDGVNFNGTTYNFEIDRTPTTKEECKEGGYMTFNAPSFENQGQCVSFVQANAHANKGL